MHQWVLTYISSSSPVGHKATTTMLIVAVVSIRVFFRGGLDNPIPNLQPEGPSAGFCLVPLLRPPRLSLTG